MLLTIRGGETVEVRQTLVRDDWFATEDGRILSVRKNGRVIIRKTGLNSKSRSGRLIIQLRNGRKVTSALVHRVVYEAWRGKVPEGLELDHIDRNPLNNALSNLRAVTRSANIANSASRKRKTSLPRGVLKTRRGSNYHASIGVKCQKRYLGTFASPECAHTMYRIAFYSEHGFEAPA